MNDEDILSRLKVIDRRLRQISTEEAASVLAGGLASAGIGEEERLRLIAETERISMSSMVRSTIECRPTSWKCCQKLLLAKA